MQRIPTLSEADISLFELKTRFVRNYLTFAGKNSKDFLLYISGPGVYVFMKKRKTSINDSGYLVFDTDERLGLVFGMDDEGNLVVEYGGEE